MLQIYDSATRAKVEFRPRIEGRVSMYVCGPTPYDVPHVGHGRTAIVFDTIRRYLRWRGYEVTYVTNVTDVEDKIIARAAQRDTSEPELAARYEAVYWDELRRLGVKRPDEVPRATEFIEQMQALVAELVAAGKAYVIEGQGVYFATDTYDGYGELSHRSRDDLADGAGARVDVDERKRSPLDFALWKSAKPGEPRWPSPWGDGRPGWHIECSAMSLDILGEGFDIHGGGSDLLFPHHENERAQAEAAGHRFARYWLHSAMVMVGGEKMSKSLGNFTDLGDALDRHGARAFRLLALQTHYRRQMEITDEHLAAASRGARRLDDFVRRADVAGVDWTDDVGGPFDDFVAAMDDDFDTPAALATIFERVSAANVAIDRGDLDEAAPLVATVHELCDVLGLTIGAGDVATTVGGPSDEEIDRLVAERDSARATRDYDAADRIRDELGDLGVTLEDTPQGTIWHR